MREMARRVSEGRSGGDAERVNQSVIASTRIFDHVTPFARFPIPEATRQLTIILMVPMINTATVVPLLARMGLNWLCNSPHLTLSKLWMP